MSEQLDKKPYEPDEPKENQPEQIPVPDHVVLLTVIRKANGSISCIDNMKDCRSIEEALVIRSKVWYWCDKFIQFCEYMQAKEKENLRVQPSFIQGLRNGLKKK